MSQKIALISGARGQDASYLAELLLEKGYKVVATERRSSSPNYSNIKHLIDNTNYILEEGDITDFGSVARLLEKYKPDEFYNLAAQSFVAASWNQPIATCEIDFVGVCNCLEAVRLFSPKTKFFQASTSEVYGDVLSDMQDEDTPARPRSPYAAAKYGAEGLIKVYRDSYGIFACFARSFNHESPRRGKQFVTRKITNWIGESFKKVDLFITKEGKKYSNNNMTKFFNVQEAFELAIKQGYLNPLRLGNLEAKRDWTHAKDIVRGMWLMLQQEKPDDYVLASGKTRSIKEFLHSAAYHAGLYNWEPLVVQDEKFYRPADVNLLCGSYAKAKKNLGWEPEISFNQLVKEMVETDLTDDRDV